MIHCSCNMFVIYLLTNCKSIGTKVREHFYVHSSYRYFINKNVKHEKLSFCCIREWEYSEIEKIKKKTEINLRYHRKKTKKRTVANKAIYRPDSRDERGRNDVQLDGRRSMEKSGQRLRNFKRKMKEKQEDSKIRISLRFRRQRDRFRKLFDRVFGRGREER